VKIERGGWKKEDRKTEDQLLITDHWWLITDYRSPITNDWLPKTTNCC